MADISKCRGNECPVRSNCYRFTANDAGLRQAYFIDPPYDYAKGSCEYYWPTIQPKRITPNEA